MEITATAGLDLELSKVDGDLIQKLFVIEEGLKKLPQIDIPTKHYFAGNLYAREITIGKDQLIIGRLHRYSQINVISKGDVTVLTENGWKRMKAPYTFESPAGIKRAIYSYEDTVMTTFIATEEKDIDKMDDLLTIGSYQEYLKVILDKGEIKCLS